MSEKEILLSGKKVMKKFQGASEPVLNDIDIDIYQGDFTVLMGSSGAGKSTLLYALSGMDRISSGQVLYRGQEISHYNENQMARLRSEAFGFVFQQAHLVSNLTLLENVLVAGYVGKGQTASQVQTRAKELLHRMHVDEAENRLPAQVSGGEVQRAAIARAMIHSPSLIFADEPTGALNRRNTDEVLNLLTDLSRDGQSILMVTHDVHCAARGNRVLYVEDGAILAEREMPPYLPEQGREREEELSSWLSSLNW